MRMGVFTWNMRGLTLNGSEEAKIALLGEMVDYSIAVTGELPVFLLQESGRLVEYLQENADWAANYQMCEAQPIAAQNIRCTTALLLPQFFTVIGHNTHTQQSLARSYIIVDAELNGENLRLGSIHAVASQSAAEDGRAFLKKCAKAPVFIAGGDFNCDPEIMQSEEQFTQRQREQGMDYEVQITNEKTHESPDGAGRTLDYICTKGVRVGRKEVYPCSVHLSEEAYSDHKPVFYEILL